MKNSKESGELPEKNVEKEKRYFFEESRRLFLLAPQSSDLKELFQWRNSDLFLETCTNKKKLNDISEFNSEIEQDFQNDRHVQTIIFHKKKKEKMGTLYSYRKEGYNEKSVFITTFLDQQYQKNTFGVDAFSLFMKYLFEEKDIEKIYTEVYANNTLSLSTMMSGGFEVVETDKNYRFKKGEKTDLITLVFDKNNKDQMKKLERVLSIFSK